jgi:protein O-mannosyl-transferase
MAVHGRSLLFEFTRTDDKVLLLDDEAFIRDRANIPKAFTRPFFPGAPRGETYYRPLVTTSFILDAQWSGVRPFPYHLTNVLLHALAVGLFCLLLMRLGFGSREAAIGASLFAVHPALTEAVAWIPGRCDLLLGVGFLVSALGLLRMLESGRRRDLTLHLGGLMVALLSKEAALTIPLVFCVLLWILSGGRRLLRRIELWAGWAGAVAIWILLRSTLGSVTSGGGSDRLPVLMAHLPVLLMHAGKLIVPTNLAVLASAKDTAWSVGAMVAIGLLGGGLALRTPLYWWGLATFLLFLLPTLPVSDFLILENRLYAPAMGVIVAVVTAGAVMAARWPRAKPSLAVAAGVVVLAGTGATWSYAGRFRNPEEFTQDAIRTSPHLGLAHLNRGIVLQVEGKVDEAEREYERAIEFDPTQSITHNNLGLISMNRGDLAAAERLLRRELELNPSYDKAHFNLGLVLARQGRVGEASDSWRQALRINPGNGDAQANLERAQAILAGKSTTQVAVDVDKIPTDVLVGLYKQALERDPHNAAIRASYGELCRKRKLSCPEP